MCLPLTVLPPMVMMCLAPVVMILPQCLTICFPLPSTANDTSTASHIVTSSLVKEDGNCWLRKLDLTFRDKQSSEWLNDNIVFASQCLLREQSSGRIDGWKSTQCSKRSEKFPCLPANCAFVQVVHVAGNHWITTSNVNPNDNTHYRDRVSIYDSICLQNTPYANS